MLLQLLLVDLLPFLYSALLLVFYNPNIYGLHCCLLSLSLTIIDNTLFYSCIAVAHIVVMVLPLLVAVTAFVTTLQLLSLLVAVSFGYCQFIVAISVLPPIAVAGLSVLVGSCSQLIVAFR